MPKKFRNKRTLILISLIAILVLGAGVAIYIQQHRIKPNQSEAAKTSNTYKQNTTQPSSSKPTNSSASPAKTTEISVDKPTLTKSASSAPAGVTMDFTCWGKDGTFCEVTLINDQTGENITLPRTKITTDKIGQSTAYWTWNTKAGTWEATATASNSGGSKASSDSQIVTVRP
ncbi:MAG TPA: hypothetical protein VLH77_00065 [Gammaproteobacteria bacterium]|nr:hypothetical protein [Gammaproteobacteria bacterium]